MSYIVVRQAIIQRVSLTANYENYVRFFSPHLIGQDANGVPVVVGFQYGGGRPGGLLSSNGEWCRFLVPRLHYARFNGDKWQAGPAAGKPVVGLSIDIAA